MNNKFDELAKGLAQSVTRRQPVAQTPLRWRLAALGAACLAAPLAAQAGLPPVITNVAAAQQPGTKLVNIQYIISDPDSSSVNVYIKVSKDSGGTWTVPAYTFSGDYGTNISVTATPATKSVVWNAAGTGAGNLRLRIAQPLSVLLRLRYGRPD